MPARPVTTVLFDLDGTLIDSIDLILSSYRHTMRAHGHPMPSDDVWLAGLGTPLWAQFGRLVDEPAEIAAMVETYRAHNLAHHDSMVREYPGVLDAVRSLSDRGARLGIVTSKKREAAERGLALCGFDGLFDATVCADDVERHKPDPAPVTRALDLLGAAPSATLFVGDSPHDMAAGRGAGVTTVAALWGPFPRHLLEPEQPDIWIRDPMELPGLVPWST